MAWAMTKCGFLVHIFLLTLHFAAADYSCICNYNVEKIVYAKPDVNSTAIGYMYEFDCKPNADPHGHQNSKFLAVEFEHKLGYVETDEQVEAQTCPGDPPSEDRITTLATKPHGHITSTVPTVPTTQTTTTVPTTQSTTTVPTTQTTTTVPTTQTIATVPTTQTTTTVQTTQTTITVPTTKTTTTVPTTQTTTTVQTTQTTTTVPTTKTITTVPTTQTVTTVPTTKTTTPVPITQTTTPVPTTPTTTTTTTAPIPTTKTTTPVPTILTTTTMKPTTQTTTTLQTTTSTTMKPTITTMTPTTTKQTATMKPTTTMNPAATTITQTPTTTAFPYWTHEANVTGTPLQYIGVGYNLLKGNPELSTDPGLLLDKRVLLMTGTSSNIKEASLTMGSDCAPENTHYLIHGSKSLQEEMNTLVHASDTHPNELRSNAFTNNSDFAQRRNYLDGGSRVYQDLLTTCKLGTAVYHNATGNQQHFVVSHDFAKDVCKLPLDTNSTTMNEYTQFLERWGTSVVMSADLGTRTLIRFWLSRPALFEHVRNKDPSVIDHTGPLEGYSTSIAINISRYSASSVSRDTYTTHKMAATVGSKLEPSVIGLDVVPISDLIDWKYFGPLMNQLVADGECPRSSNVGDISNIANNMKTALAQYSGYRTTPSVKDYPLQLPITWPTGTYGLMKTARGCPADKVTWYSGWRNYDTENTFALNYFSPDVSTYLAGTFQKDIRTEFCLKTTPTTSVYDMNWPKGSYCILKKGTCPTGFQSGYIGWDDNDKFFGNSNAYGGILPDGVYNQNTKVYYCCRNDAHTNTSISLPTDRPFVLLRYGQTCQSVYGMNIHDVFVRWDDNDFLNGDTVGGMHPFDEGGSSSHLLHFCYYQAVGHVVSIVG